MKRRNTNRTGRSLLALALVATGALSGNSNAENRTIDGTKNNLTKPDQGSAGTMFPRLGPTMYDDGISSPRESGMMNAREVSNAICIQSAPMPNRDGLSDFVWQWGQFLDHDIDLTETSSDPAEFYPIEVSEGDKLHPMIPMMRSDYDLSTGTSIGNPRQQVNRVSSYIDGSGVYGADERRALALRTLRAGRLKTSVGNLLPFNEDSLHNANALDLPEASLFLAGDIRANEQTGLTCLHILFVREHNRLAGMIAAENPAWDDEQIYQRARKIVGALIQAITYHEFLPALLGAMAPNIAGASYNEHVDASITNEFASSLYRAGHSMVSRKLQRIQDDGSMSAGGALDVMNAFFNPSIIVDNPQNVAFVLKGLASQSQREIDSRVIDDLRNQLFGAPGSGGMDLAALNIQRGRDHGLPTYNQMREIFGLLPAVAFSDVTSDPETLSSLSSIYDTVDVIDLWVGTLAEDHLPGAAVGALLAAAMIQQFTALVEGDRLFFLFDPELAALRDELTSTKLSEIILRNTTLNHIQESVFHLPEGGLQIASVLIPESGDVELTLTGVSVNKSYTVERSADLVSWGAIRTGLSGGTKLRATDPGAANLFAKVFYRGIEEAAAP
ncbi:MAG: hypothetical protein ACJAQT_002092 [Akkermansiaceae bacterium]|jgi:hypothetical protein